MNIIKKTYIGLTILFFVSIGISVFLPMSEIFKGITAMPAVGVLIAVLYQLLRDQAEFEKKLNLQKQQQLFTLGASSHMAQIAFEKHVAFCEEYMEEVHEIVGTLFTHGPTNDVDENLRNLYVIRRKHAAWITKEIGLSLKPFETAINEISALSGLVKGLEGTDKPTRTKAIKAMYEIFKEVIGLESKNVTEENTEIAVEEVEAKIRKIIGIEELSEMRAKIVSGSLEYLKDNA